MTKEMLNLIGNLDLEAAETQMALHCAPLIMGLKASNLLIVPDYQAVCVRHLLRNTEMESFLLYRGAKYTAGQNVQAGRKAGQDYSSRIDQKAVFLLYRFQLLYDYLKNAKVIELLCRAGYHDFSFEGMLNKFAERYGAYMYGRTDFPHEMGIFLGYPAEDVQGFMENQGKNFLYAGYWKVYGHISQKTKLFHYYDRAGELIIRLLSQGVQMKEVLACA